MTTAFWISLASIVWIDLLLSGDNAVVIALVCRSLPARQQRIGIALGSTAAVGLRIIMALGISMLMGVEGLRIVGGLFLLWVAGKLVWDHGDENTERGPARTLLGAVLSIAVADASMSLDNVMAIAALAKGNAVLMAAGVALSVPLVIVGASIIKALVDRLPWIVWLGAGLLGWVAGGIIIDDPLLEEAVRTVPMVSIQIATSLACAAAGAVLVIGVGLAHRVVAAR